VPPSRTAGPRVSLLVTCVADVLEPEVATATVRVLRAAGCTVSFSPAQTCCGQPAWNSGFAEDAARVARTTLAALEAELDAGAEWIVCPAGSCTAMVRVFWPELFDVVGDAAAKARAEAVGARTRELTELLAELDLPELALPEPTTVAYHHSCHLLRELHVREQPVGLLDQIRGCERSGWVGDDRCCGFGGLFSFKLPETAEAMADEKLGALADADPAADLLVSADSTCLLHLRGRADATGRPVRTRHVAQVLDDALPRGAGEP
jgi:L-lactate dehydrogenase complex protein LldE